MEKFRLSVVLTTHLRPSLLARALQSVTALGEEVQIVLCADESTKGTLAVAFEHLREHDIFVAAPGLQGPAETRNLGITLAKGDYISFLDDDDTLNPSVRSILDKFDGANVYFANYRKIFEEETPDGRKEMRRVEKATSKKPISSLLVRNSLHIGCFFSPRAIAQDARFRADLTSSEDWEFLLQLYEKAPFKHLEAVGSNWHITEGEASRDKVGKRVRAKNTRLIYSLHPTDDPDTLDDRTRRLQDLEGGSS